MSAVNSKAKTTLTVENSCDEIVDVINSITTDLSITTVVSGLGSYSVTTDGYYIAFAMGTSGSSTSNSSVSTTGTVVYKNSVDHSTGSYRIAIIKAVAGNSISASSSNTKKNRLYNKDSLVNVVKELFRN